MAEVVLAVAASHAPGLAGLYAGAPEDTKAEVDKMYGTMAAEIAAADLDVLIDDLRSGKLDGDIPAHGVLARVRQSIPADRAAGVVTPEQVGAPAWFPAKYPS